MQECNQRRVWDCGWTWLMAICSAFKERMLPANQAPSFLDLTDLAGGSLLAIYCACNDTDCKYAFNQPNEESRSKELGTNTRSRKLELTTTKLMEKRGSRTTGLQLPSNFSCICEWISAIKKLDLFFDI